MVEGRKVETLRGPVWVVRGEEGAAVGRIRGIVRGVLVLLVAPTDDPEADYERGRLQALREFGAPMIFYGAGRVHNALEMRERRAAPECRRLTSLI